ncbi:AbiV family abortive infection protein [Rhodophyticola porphyridii]|uniref:AbiV family abortive infection protein n=1 Tax=Rhodophyticola porphyridii TaxID=1852017 RepID=UPI0035D0ACA5
MTTKEQQAENVKKFRYKDWDDFIERLASGELSVFDTIRAHHEQIYEKQDYEGYINQARASYVMMQDERIISRLMQEITEKLKEHTGKDFDSKAIKRDVNAKDGIRLFDKLGKMQAEAYGDGPPLITGKSFDECLAQYQALTGYVEELWTRAYDQFGQGNYPLATFFSILAIEEIGKLGRIWHDLMAWDRPLKEAKTDLGVLGKSHHKKHFLGVVPGSIINARLDRLIGKKTVKSILEDVESGKIEKLRQSCLYIDFKDGRSHLPGEQVDQDTARVFVTLSGELWMEILGHFPWDFHRMLEKVKEAELAIGLPEELVQPY